MDKLIDFIKKWLWTLLPLGILITVIALKSSDKTAEMMKEIPVISSESELREAMKNEPIVYRLLNMKVTGGKCEDPLNFINGEFYSIAYTKYCYEDNIGSNDSEYEWRVEDIRKPEVHASSLILFDDIEVEFDNLKISGDSVNIAEYLKFSSEEVRNNCCDNFYYPNGIGNINWNIRYALYAIPLGSSISTLAVVGNNSVRLAPILQSSCVIVKDGSFEDLNYEASETEAGFMALSLFMILLGIFGIVLKLITKIIIKMNEKKA